MHRVKQSLLLVFGFISLGAGILGIALPVLPTTPFLILSLILFAKSSTRVADWFMSTRIYRKHLASYHATGKMMRRTKRDALVLVTLLIGTLIVLVDNLVMRIVLGIVLLAHYAVFLLHIGTISDEEHRDVIARMQQAQRKGLEDDQDITHQ
jgi:uncharacterized protein